MFSPVPANEPARLTTLRAMDVLDSPPEADFDDIVRLASEICGAPISLVTLVDAQRQWFKAKIGMDADETSRDVSFCAHAIMGRDLMVVPDARTDARFSDHPSVRAGGGIRFYAGAPLVTADGSALGTLCVVDHDPHWLTLDQLRALRALARQVTDQLELRRLTLARPDHPSEHRDLDLAYLLERRVAELRPIADGRNTSIVLVPADPTPVRGDPRQLGRALGYVVFTALKSAPAGSRIAVRVGPRPVPVLDLSHTGGTIAPAWQADLGGAGTADEPVPAAVAAVLRAHGVALTTTCESVGSTDVRIQLAFPTR